MKRIFILLIIGLATLTSCSSYKLVREYVKTTDKLLEEIEMMMDDNGIPFGDTICEGDTWSDYVELRNKLPY